MKVSELQSEIVPDRSIGVVQENCRMIEDRDNSPAVPNGSGSSVPEERIDEFVQLLAQNQRRLLVYLTSLMHDRDAVNDVLQETNLVLWREFKKFEIGTSFTAWSCRIAYNQMLAWRKKQQRDRLQFSEEFLRVVSHELDAESDRLDQRMTALVQCMKSLPDHHRELIRHRYTDGRAIEEIAFQANRSVEAVYRMLSRIRHTLHDCATRTIAAGDFS